MDTNVCSDPAAMSILRRGLFEEGWLGGVSGFGIGTLVHSGSSSSPLLQKAASEATSVAKNSQYRDIMHVYAKLSYGGGAQRTTTLTLTCPNHPLQRALSTFANSHLQRATSKRLEFFIKSAGTKLWYEKQYRAKYAVMSESPPSQEFSHSSPILTSSSPLSVA